MMNYEEITKKYDLFESVNNYQSYLKNIQIKDNSVLYHYTSYKGLQGILSSKRLWFTDYRHLNDTSEVNHSIKLIEDQIKIKQDMHEKNTLNEFLCIFKKVLEHYTIGTFSFCQKEDYLPAWRWYANNGSGFTIGIKPKTINELWSEKNHGGNTSWVFDNYQIDYEHTKYNVFINKCLNILTEKLKKFTSLTDNLYVRLHMATNLLCLLPQIKHKAYREEHECRFVMTEKDTSNKKNIKSNPKPDERGYFLRPNSREENQFIKPIPTIISETFNKEVITEIGIGPACNKDQAESSIKTLLQQNGFDEGKIKIYKSEIPFRNQF